MAVNTIALRFATTTAVAFIAAISTFIGVAGLFGGGWQGYLVAGFVFFLVFAVAYSVKWIQLRPHPASPIAIRPTPPVSKPGVRQQKSNRMDTPARHQRSAEAKVRTSGLVCDPGPYDIDGGEMVIIELDVRKGEHANGHLAEETGDDFDWYIVDEDNLVDARDREGFDYAQGGEGVSADRVRWTVRQEGPWFLIIDLYRRSNPRRVEVNLRHS